MCNHKIISSIQIFNSNFIKYIISIRIKMHFKITLFSYHLQTHTTEVYFNLTLNIALFPNTPTQIFETRHLFILRSRYVYIWTNCSVLQYNVNTSYFCQNEDAESLIVKFTFSLSDKSWGRKFFRNKWKSE